MSQLETEIADAHQHRIGRHSRMIVGGKEPEGNPVRAWEEAEPTTGIVGIRPANG